MQRIYRQLAQTTKDRISNSSKGKPKSEEHKRNISQAMKQYWATIPNKPPQITMNDLIGAKY